MPEVHISQYLDQILHALDGVEDGGDVERMKEINNIRRQIETYQIGIQRVDTKQMVMCILAGLDDLKPRIEALIMKDPGNTRTWPAPPDSGERISRVITMPPEPN